MSISKNLFLAREVLGRGARSPAVYMEIHEDTRTTLTTKLPAKRVFRGAQMPLNAAVVILNRRSRPELISGSNIFSIYEIPRV